MAKDKQFSNSIYALPSHTYFLIFVSKTIIYAIQNDNGYARYLRANETACPANNTHEVIKVTTNKINLIISDTSIFKRAFK